MWLALFAHVLFFTYSSNGISPQVSAADLQARQRLQQPRRLEPADVPVILAGMRSALRGAYLVIAVADVQFDRPSSTEFWLDDSAEVRFRRTATRDPATKDLEVTLDEVTSLRARLCADQQARDGRLAITYGYWKGTWQTAYGRIHTPTHEIDTLWQLARGELIDDGLRRFEGRTVRVLGYRPPGLFTYRFWLDVETLRPLRYSLEATVDGKGGEVVETITYPPPVPIERPSGSRVPDCV